MKKTHKQKANKHKQKTFPSNPLTSKSYPVDNNIFHIFTYFTIPLEFHMYPSHTYVHVTNNFINIEVYSVL